MSRKKETKKDIQPVKEPAVQKSPIEDILADRFARYSKYIIQERALPDARDGLKPVQRRILYAMEEAGNTWNRPYHKSAKTVGNVIGNYHPHGDSSVYEAMVRLSQSWKLNEPLIDMQGNNGSIDDDPAAAMRYTECRLSHITDTMMEDLDKKTVEWAPNFSDEKLEPTVLPARYPALLTTGITGIAAGYATNIPPHNLGEIIDACLLRLKKPDCTLEEAMEYVHGPDFPTGGIVMDRKAIEQVFRTGRGRVSVRSVCTIEEKKNLKQIIVTEIPYETVKSNLVRQLDEVRLSGKVSGILDVRDESGRSGLRIAIDLKPDAPAETILNWLYKNTGLQTNYHYNMVAIVDRSPVQLSLLQAIDAFLTFREDVVLRRTRYDLEQKKARLHIVAGLILALSQLDEVIAVIRASQDKADARSNLMKTFGFSYEQAEAIVIMRLYRLTHTDITALEEESAQLEKEIASLQGILDSPARLKSVLRKELSAVKKEFATPRRTKIQALEEEIVIDEQAMIPDEAVQVALSRDGYVKRVSMRSFSSSSDRISGRKDGDFILSQGPARTRQKLLFFTRSGKYGFLPVHKLPEGRWKDTGTHLSALIKMEPGEKIVQAYIVPAFEAPIQIVALSRLGYAKRFALSDLEAVRMSRTPIFMKLPEGDEVVSVQASLHGSDEVMAVSAGGFALAYPVHQIPASSLKSRGVKAISLGKDDQGIALLAAPAEQQVLFFKEGGTKRIRNEEVPRLNRPAKGSRVFKAVKASPVSLQDVVNAGPADEILLDGNETRTLRGAEVPLMALTASWSSQNQLEVPFAPVQELVTLTGGDWQADDEPFVQEALFR